MLPWADCAWGCLAFETWDRKLRLEELKAGKTFIGVLAKLTVTSLCFQMKVDHQLSSEGKVSPLLNCAHAEFSGDFFLAPSPLGTYHQQRELNRLAGQFCNVILVFYDDHK